MNFIFVTMNPGNGGRALVHFYCLDCDEISEVISLRGLKPTICLCSKMNQLNPGIWCLSSTMFSKLIQHSCPSKRRVNGLFVIPTKLKIRPRTGNKANVGRTSSSFLIVRLQSNPWHLTMMFAPFNFHFRHARPCRCHFFRPNRNIFTRNRIG